MTKSTASRRPPKNAAAPAPAPGERLYCYTCGRLMSPRKPTTTPQKYCSTTCRRQKPSFLEAGIEDTFVRLLSQNARKVVECGDVENIHFCGGEDGIGRAESSRREREDELGCGVSGSKGSGRDGVFMDDGEDEGEDGGVPLPSRSETDPAARVLVQDRGMDAREQGMRKARQREMVRQAARRGVAFGFLVEGGGAEDGGSEDGSGGDGLGEGKEEGERRRRRRVEAVQGGRVVESSFAKGEWGVRWREGV